MAIPKIIHYVWVGGGEKPKNILRCMESWKKHLQGYEIIEWNESNFDIHSSPFVEEAYEKKKWAYVSDYIRAYALYQMGGIYLDTDNVLLASPDRFLQDRAFVGFENPDYPFTAMFGAEKGHPFVLDILKSYEGKAFDYDRKDEMASVNTKSVSEILVQKYGCKVNNREQLLPEGIRVYPDGVLCNPSKDSAAIHVFTGTWMEGKASWKKKPVLYLKSRIRGPFSLRFYLFARKFF